jgi:uncharacterized RmlC-like cupin family protein
VDGSERISLIRPADREAADPTPGMTREQAIAVDGMWSGYVTTDPHMLSGWHHHGAHETAIYVVDGALRMESGPSGADVIEAGPGDFLRVPPGVVHREGNPGDTPAHVVVTRAGRGPVTVNVDGPDIDRG